MLTLLLAVAVVAGYLLGHARPARRLSDWAHWQMYGRRVTRASWRWWATQPIFACEITTLLALHPLDTVRNWRTRNAPPVRGPAVRLRGEP